MSGISAENSVTAAAGGAAAGHAPAASGQSSNGDFAGLLSNMIEGQATSLLASSVASGTSASQGSVGALGSMTAGGDALGSLLTSASGEKDSASELGVMLMFMLMNMNSGSDSSMMMLSSLLSAASGDRSYGEAGLPSLQTGSLFDTLVGASTASRPSVPSTGAGGELAPLSCWVPTNPRITGNESCRSAEQLNRIIAQFDVESTARYTPHKYGGDTYCNIFVWDVTSALGCEIPHWVDSQTGAPRQFPDIEGAYEMGANATYKWLDEHGSDYGWVEVTAEQAQMYANQGYPAVTTWKNPGGGAGHVQIVRPSEDGAFDASRGVAVAQAGGHNYEYTYAGSIYSDSSLSQVRYYVHA
jgi:hypothetical protein